jgi:hypothetical protein
MRVVSASNTVDSEEEEGAIRLAASSFTFFKVTIEVGRKKGEVADEKNVCLYRNQW